MGRAFHLLTCEYPPKRGGVADYTAVIAAGLAAAGCEVHVWGPGNDPRPDVEASGVTVHRVAGRFGPAGLARLGRGLDRFPGPRTLVVQYVPHGFGWKAMNVAFAAWVYARRAVSRDDVRVMFHEVAFPWVRRPLKHNVIAAVTRATAALLCRACTRAYVSVPGWLDLLKSLGGARVPTRWLPVPTTLPADPPAGLVAAKRLGAPTVGHFGTYGPLITSLLGPALGAVLDRRPDARVVLIGANGDRWRDEFLRTRPGDAPRVTATGERPTPELAAWLRACDVVVQPYPDGASSRRTTFTAALANAVPVVTNRGHLTDPLVAAAPVAFAPVDRLADAALELLDSPGRRRELGEAGRRYYGEQFAADRTVAALLADPPRPGATGCPPGGC